MPLRHHMALGWALVIATLAMVGFWVPPRDSKIGESYLIFFFHFPSAMCCMVFFLIAGALSLAHLSSRTPRTDLLAASAAEIGVLSCTVTLATGSTWARVAWGIWWDPSDARLMSVAILWLTFVGYLVLRANIEEPAQRGRFSGVYGAVGSLNVFFVYYAIRIFGEAHHPMEIALAETSMKATRWFGALAFFVLYSAFWRLRLQTLDALQRARELEGRIVDLEVRA